MAEEFRSSTRVHPIVGRLGEDYQRRIKATMIANTKERELNEALEAKQNPSVEDQLEYYKTKSKRDSQARYDAELELARVQRKARQHRNNIRGMQRSLRIAKLEAQTIQMHFTSLFRAKTTEQLYAANVALEKELKQLRGA